MDGKYAHVEVRLRGSSRMVPDRYQSQRTWFNQRIASAQGTDNEEGGAYATKVKIVILATATAPESRPKPTPASDKKAPHADIASNVFRPRRCERAGLATLRGHSRRDRRTSIKKMGGNVMITFTMVIPRETKGPKSGNAFERMSLL